MLRMPRWRLCFSLLFLASLSTTPGCSSDGSAGPVDPKVVIEKASGGDGNARQSAKARADSEEAAKKHPKLH